MMANPIVKCHKRLIFFLEIIEVSTLFVNISKVVKYYYFLYMRTGKGEYNAAITK